ncbi:hypothetical protein [Kamptonema formosum]|uniref:hypothetical protein n=1 Tax=Kamptonema formosum TaxID=331992 RepID=UPI00034B7911|nr:hypothetical protein [Oscillatoria sp. PCC 10802]
MSKLFDFLTDLTTNPRQQEAFAKAPDTVMAAVGLSELERAALKSGNSARIAATFTNHIIPSAFSLVDPAPDPFPDPDPPDSDEPDSDSPDGENRALGQQYASK